MERKFEFVRVDNDAASTVSQYFLSPDAMIEIANQLRTLQKPGGLITVFDPATGTLAVCAARVADDGQYLLSWSLTGPLSEADARAQARDAADHADGQLRGGPAH